MARQHLERYVSSTLSEVKEIWYQKNQVMPLSYTQSVGDFIVLTEKFNFVIECKECKDMENKNKFYFSSMTQLNDLRIFKEKLKRNESLLLLMFWRGTVKKSSIFLITIEKLLKCMETKKGVSSKECEELFYKIGTFQELGELLR